MNISGDSVNTQEQLGEQQPQPDDAIAPEAIANFKLGLVTGAIYVAGEQSLDTHADKIFSEFKGIGAGWIRIEADWKDQGVPVSDSVYKLIVQKAHYYGLKVIVLLAGDEYGRFNYADDNSDSQPNQPPRIDEFTSRYVTRLNYLATQVFTGASYADAFEITNEPNQCLLGDSTCKGSNGIRGFRVGGNAFAWLLRRVWEWKTKNNRPELIISGGTISTYYNSPDEPWWNRFFTSGAWQNGENCGYNTGRQCPRPFDYMGVHPYNPFSITQDEVNASNFARWKQITRTLLSELAAKIDQVSRTSGTRLFVTEFGWQMCSPQGFSPNANCVNALEQGAAGMQAAVEAFRDSGVVPVALWYDYRNDYDYGKNVVINRFGLRRVWDGASYSAKVPYWQKFKDLAGGTGSNDPEFYWR